MTYKIEIEVGGNVYTLDVFSPTLMNEYGKQTHLEVDVLRNEFESIKDSNTISDAEVYFFDFGTRVFGGRIVDYRNTDDRVVLQVGSFEEDAIKAKPTVASLTFVGVSDSDIIENAIDRVDILSKGTIQTINPDVDLLFSNASPAKMMRKVQRQTGGYLVFNANGAVDYLENAGSDKTAIVIGPAQSNVSDSFEVEERDRQDYTHIRVLGASEGDSQIKAEAVANSYSSGDRQIWRKYTDKEITTDSRAQSVANTLISEYDNDPVRLDISTIIFGVDVDIGDTFSVVSSVDAIDQEMTVVKKNELFQGSDSIYDVVLSNRVLTRLDSAVKRRRDVEKFNEAFQGDIVTLNAGGYRAPVDSNTNYELTVRVPPDVKKELTAEVEVVGLPYRSYSSGAAGGGNHTHTVNVEHPKHSHTIAGTTGLSSNENHNIGKSFNVDPSIDQQQGFPKTIATETIASSPSSFPLIVNGAIGIEAGDGNSFDKLDLTVFDRDTNSTYDIVNEVGRTEPFNYQSGTTTIFDDVNGHTLDLQIKCSYVNGRVTDLQGDWGWDFVRPHTHGVDEASSEELGTTESETSDPSGTHTHNPDPGVIEQFNGQQITPSNVDLIVNGTTVSSNIGSDRFETVVDISNELSTGFNNIEVTSDSLGHIRATTFLDLYRQITQ